SDPVAYELIELDRVYSQLAAAAAPGQQPAPILLGIDQQAGTLHYALPNPLPEPITVTYGPPRSAGLEFAAPAEATVRIPPNGKAEAILPFRVTEPSKVLPIEGMKVSLSTPVGSCEVRVEPPDLACRRLVASGRTQTPITVDGKPDEPAWKMAPAISDFSQARWGRPVRPARPIQADIRLLHDADNLYVLVDTMWAINKYPRRGKTAEESDHVCVYLAGPKTATTLYVDSDNRTTTQAEPEGGLVGVQSAVGLDGIHVRWEIAIPLAVFLGEGTSDRTISFNLQQRRGWDYHTLSPTFGAPLSRSTAGYLRLD
ncbi:MAG TPA: hypothetical protein VLM89_16645, partial [Phycisphaerae bacterium]|nr:hypothetical protein [Phycisphaerae bacterium]